MTVITTNLLSMGAQANLNRANSTLATAMERLSSGLRINGAKDDAAGQAIGNRMTSQINGRAMAQRNANDGVSLSQTAQGVLDSINDKLHRIRELTVQGLNGTLSTRDSDAIQAEINQNLQEIDRQAASAEYNGIRLMTGEAGQVQLQVGANDGQVLGLDLSPPGFSVEALGLEDLNIAGIDGEAIERDTLRGQARDIPLYDTATTLTFSSGTQQPLYFANGFGYYTSDGAGGFSRVTVTANHETATDTSQVNIHTPRPIFNSELAVEPKPIPPLPADQRLVEADGITYREERLADGSLAYRQAGVSIEYQEAWEQRTREDGTTYDHRLYPANVILEPDVIPEPGEYTDVSGSFTFGSQSYSLDDATNVSFNQAGGSVLADGRLVESPAGELYLASGAAGDERFYRLDNVQTQDRLLLNAEASPIVPEPGENFPEVSGSFSFDGESYTLADFDELGFTPAGATLVQSDVDSSLFLRTDNGSGGFDYFALSQVTTERDLTLQAATQGFAGIDLSGLPTLVDPETPSVNFTALDTGNISFDGADFAGLSELTLVQRTTSEGQWMIRGRQADGGLAYFEANLKLEVDASGQPVAAIATATQSEPTILGVDSHERDRVSGYSQITIDPRNVSVAYTDAQGQTFEDVLRENEDGNYYFALPGESTVIGGYKTATLVDLEGTTEVVLRTVNGGSEVVVYYPSNVNMGNNLSVVALTDADGFNDDGVPHTRLQIRENGEDFRLRVPRNPLAALDRAIGMVDAKRSHLGAMENRLVDVVLSNEQTGIDLSAARSRIMDADYAVETSNMVKAQILQQAGSSMLAQANVVPENVLALLG